MNLHRAITPCLLLLLGSCQPSVLCDPGQYEMGGGCYPEPPKDSGTQSDDDAGAGEADGGDGCGSDPSEGFGVACSSSSQCGCGAAHCATDPLGYCTKINCDPTEAEACPPDWTCLTIPAGASPDPNITSLCLSP
jgi:hypothetical protein